MALVVPANDVRGRTMAWRPVVRPALVLLAVVLAYRTSLATLLESMRLDTPLAHLALVPLIAAGLAFVSRRDDAGPDIHDRQLDWIVGLALCAGAVVANVVLPGRLSTQFWEWRVDLLTFPFFVAGAVAIAFGVRSLWKFRLAVLFLFLAWPYPYARVIDRYLGDFTQVTIRVLNSVLGHVHIATQVLGTDSVFQVIHRGAPVQMSVASACSGANGLVGFLLVASAFVLVVDGSKRRKVVWLLVGAALVWLLNIVRILIIFWAARRWGEAVAIEGFHPYTGLVVFNLAVVLMILAMRPFGLRFKSRRKPATSVGGSAMNGGSPSRPGNRPPTIVALGFIAVFALGVGLFNGDLRQYDRVANSFGTPRLTSFASSRETPGGWQLNDADHYDWAKRFFGSSSTWNRYTYNYTDRPGASAALQGNVPITADIIETGDRASFSAYGVEACYKFHGYTVKGRQSVDLGSGIVGGLLTWTSSETELTWTTLYWHWPIKTGAGTRYERVTLVLNDQPTNTFTSPPVSTDTAKQLQLDLNDVLRGAGSAEAKARLVATRQFLIGFARNLIDLRHPAAT